MRPTVGAAESAARGFALNNDPNLVKEYQDASDRIAPAFAELTDMYTIQSEFEAKVEAEFNRMIEWSLTGAS